MAAKPDPFASPKRRLARAKQHINRLEKRIYSFFKKAPYARVIEKDADGVTDLHKIKFTRPIPDACDLAATEALEGLRATLDQLGYATAVLAGKVDPKQTQFPIADDLAGLDNIIARKRCNDLPDEIMALFRSFQPYKGGNDPIWALNRLCNANKHKLLIPVGIAAGMHLKRGRIAAGAFSSVAIPNPVWNRRKNEIVFGRVGPGAQFEYDMQMGFLITLDDPEAAKGEEAVAVLRRMAAEVKRILVETEVKCRKIGLMK